MGVSKGDWSADISPSKSQKHMKLKDFYKNEATARAQYKLTFFGAGNKQVLSSSSKNVKKQENQTVASNGIFDTVFGVVNSIILLVVNLLKSVFGGLFSSSNAASGVNSNFNPASDKTQKPEPKSENSSSSKTPSDQTENIRKRRTARLHDL